LRGLEEAHVARVNAGRYEAADNRGGDVLNLRDVAGKGDDHAVARHDMGNQRRGVDARGEGFRGHLSGLVARHTGRKVKRDHARVLATFEDERIGGSVVERDAIHGG
jgi:hypothetical protein